MTTEDQDTEEEEEWPPTFDIELTRRKDAIMRCYELMEQLTEEYGGRGRIRSTGEDKLSVELEYDIPSKGEKRIQDEPQCPKCGNTDIEEAAMAGMPMKYICLDCDNSWAPVP